MSPVIFDNVVIKELAAAERVCVRPVLSIVQDRLTGQATTVPIPCGATRESVCPSCAAKARWLRMTQCHEGWHATTEPVPLDGQPSGEADADDNEGGDQDQEEQDDAESRRARSTRRRQDAPDLPTKPVEKRTIGQVFHAPDGKIYRPSMFITLTLPSYGKVIRGRGIPARPSSYDYRRAALDALHFPKLFDRWMQNLRRCAGYKVQYFAALEPQKRLAPHLHTAIRGAIPRATIKAVTKATYLQLWWPQMDTPVYVHRTPVWEGEAYRDPDTGFALPTWDHALAAIDLCDDAEPAHVMRLGAQVDVKGIVSGTPDSERAVRYLTKYLTKAVSETYTDPDTDEVDQAYEAHIDRLHEEVRWLPCNPECANWLRFGVQPKNPGPGLTPGQCHAKAHDREHVGIGGRRVLVSRGWSGKTLTEHKADRAAVVRAALEAAGIDAPDAGRMSAEALAEDGQPRYVWHRAQLHDEEYAEVVMASVLEARRWRTQYERAKTHATQAGTDPPVDTHSATNQLAAAGAARRRRGSG